MSLWTSLEPSSATVDPGSSTRVRLRLRNTGDVVDEYRFEPVGPVAPWTTVEPPALRLYPGTTGTVELTFSPPRTPDAAAGPNPYAVRITPTEHPEATSAPEGNLTITPFTEVRAELVPVTVKGRFRGRPRLAVDNLGNTKLTASVGGSDNGDSIDYDLYPASVQIEPGRAAFVKATLKPRRITWFGQKQQRPYTLTVQRSGVEPLPVQGTFVQRSFLPRWLAACFGTVVALAVAFTMVWLAYKPSVASGATEKAVDAANVLKPSPTATLSPTPTVQPTTDKPEQPKTPPPATREQKSSGGGEQESASKPKKPAPVVPAKNILLKNATTKTCLDIPRNSDGSVNVTDDPSQQGCVQTAGSTQRWDLEVRYPKMGPGGTPLFHIRNVVSQRCVDIVGLGSDPLGTKIQQAYCDGTTRDNQLWWIDKQPSGAYWIRNYASDNACLDVFGHVDTSDGATLTIAGCTNIDDQEWQIIRTKQP